VRLCCCRPDLAPASQVTLALRRRCSWGRRVATVASWPSRPAQGSGRSETARGTQRQSAHSTATARAAQTRRMRVSANSPIRSTRTATETLSTESRLTTQRRGTGSSPGSRPTSLTRPRIVVVHGATSARRCRGITASRESTTTGRRPIPALSHHQTSPRAGNAVTTGPRLPGMTRGRPTRPVRRVGARRTRRNSRRPGPNGDAPPGLGAPRRSWQRQCCQTAPGGRPAEGRHPRLC